MTPPDETSRRRLLGSVVSFSSPSAEARHRFDACYGAFPVAVDPPTIQTELVQNSEGWIARVSTRPSATGTDLISGFRALNHQLLHAVMRADASCFYLHAGVVAWDDRAVVLPGLSGAGKSTLVLALIQRGARFLSDELMVYDPSTGLVRSFPRAPKIRDVCVPWFPEWTSHWVGSGEGRFLPLAALGSPPTAEARVRFVALPRWHPEHTTLSEPRRGGRLVLELTGSVLNFGTHRERSIDHLTALVSGIEGRGVDWNDPHRAAALIAEIAA